MASTGGPDAGARSHSRRRIAVWTLIGVGLAVIIGGILINVLTNTDVAWLLLCYLAGMILLLMGGFLLVRLSN
jgi:uncharacterized protein (DUF58 family)